MVDALRRLGHPAAEPLLREQLRTGTLLLQRDAAIALASAAEPDAEALVWLRKGIASEDVEQRRQTWRWISFSTEVAPHFVDEAVVRLSAGNDAQDASRLRTLLSTAAKVRRPAVLAALERLSRHRDDEVANMAVGLLQELQPDPPR
jgi:hypothetical protein